MQRKLDQIISFRLLGLAQLTQYDALSAAMERRAIDARAASEALRLCGDVGDKPGESQARLFLDSVFCSSPELQFLLTCTAQQAVGYFRNRAKSLQCLDHAYPNGWVQHQHDQHALSSVDSTDNMDNLADMHGMYMFVVDCELFWMYGAKPTDQQRQEIDQLAACVHQKLRQMDP